MWPGHGWFEADALHRVVSYTPLWNDDLLRVVREAAEGFEPPPKGFNGATGLYAGEQDCFAFLIDPTGWTEIGGDVVPCSQGMGWF